jgi:hypothetical protein
MTIDRSTSPRPGDRGIAFYMVVLFTVFLGGLCLAFRGSFTAAVRDRSRERAAVAAVYAAQGGVERARAALARDPSWKGGATAVGRGSAEVVVREVPGEPGYRTVVSVGAIPGPGVGNVAAKRRVEVVLLLGEGLPRIVSWRDD